MLVVDDDADMIEVIELVLHDAGYATRTAMNGQQALDAVARSMPALIVLDMLMPVMNGWQFAREFRARYGPRRADRRRDGGGERAHRGDEIDAAGVLPKPFEVSDLLGVPGRASRAGAATPAPVL